MEPSFWHRCWERSTYGFHQHDIHPFLLNEFTTLVKKDESNVFVPLCGKSLDMLYLSQHMHVTGSELSEIACTDFFNEHKINYTLSSQSEFARYQSDDITLYQGDFFTLTPTLLPTFDWIYDRAALIALPPEMQAKYAKHLSKFIKPHTRLFLVSIEYPNEELTGPPFAIEQPAIERLFASFDVKCVAERPLDDKKFAQRTFNVSYLIEKAYEITLPR